MTFNEANTIESAIVRETSSTEYGDLRWEFIHGPGLPREVGEVMLEGVLRDALIALNPCIAANPDQADEVIHRLRGVLLDAKHSGLVSANEKFAEWLLGEHSMPFGKDGEHETIRLIDLETAKNNHYIVSDQVTYKPAPTKEKRFDIVFYINGLPLIVGEVKTPVRPAITWADGVKDFQKDYWPVVPDFFVANLLCFASEGKEFRYAPIGAPVQHWSPWHHTDDRDDLPQTLETVLESAKRLLHPRTVLQILQSFNAYSTTEDGRRIKVIARYPQMEAAKLMVDRVADGTIKQGLIWHFQGSGKSLLMVFAARLLKSRRDLQNPTIVIVVDRTDLDSQIGATFDGADVPGVKKARSRTELQTLLAQDTRQILITTVHKFGEADGVLNDRQNIIVMVDEAHRTQEGDFGRKMRAALPNAFFFGLTGTPIARSDRNTFQWFGSEEDEGRYLNHYSYRQSIRDGATLPVKFEPRLIDLQVDQEQIDKGFEELAKAEGLEDPEKTELSLRAGKLAHLLKAPQRMEKIADDIAEHFQSRVAPSGLKGMVVLYDREACVRMKQLLDTRLGKDATDVVMITQQTDLEKWGALDLQVDADDYARWQAMDKDASAQKQLVDRYKKLEDPLQLLLVTNKLLTGFDAPICQAMYLDKPLRDANLLQAICRTNRLYGDDKAHGLIVDYLGVFNNMAKALDYDPKEVEEVVTNLQEVMVAFPELMAECVSFFPGVDRTVFGYEGLMAAQDCLKTNIERDKFGAHFNVLHKAWDAINPSPMLEEYEQDYRWLAQVYQSLQPPSGTGGLIWQSLGAKTLELIHQNVLVHDEIAELDELVMDDTGILELDDDDAKKKAHAVEISLIAEIRARNDPRWEELGLRLERLRDEYERGLLNSVEWLKALLKAAKDVKDTERETEEEVIPNGEQALTAIFEECRVETTPEIVGRVVADIDEIVKAKRFDGWQNSISGEREIKRHLRSTLFRYQLHKEQDLFDRAFDYIRDHY